MTLQPVPPEKPQPSPLARLARIPGRAWTWLTGTPPMVATRAWWGRVTRWSAQRSLLQAVTLAVVGVAGIATLVTYLFGYPWEHGWTWNAEYVPWKDRLTYAAAVVTGLGALVALIVSYRKQRDTETSRFSVAFAEAAAQLGHHAAAVRIAGAYAMAALADQHPRHRQQSIDALCGYLRLPYTPRNDQVTKTTTTTTTKTTSEVIEHVHQPGEREVRLTIIRIIRDHLRPQAPTSWQGHDFDFTGATFDGGDFTGATFSGGTVSFTWATFSGGYVDFFGAAFSGGDVNFLEATFSGCTVDFTGATFSGGDVKFSGAAFSGGTVDFTGATFSGGDVNFFRATFSGGYVDFFGAAFSGGTVDFPGATFSGGTVNFFEATFSGGTVNFTKAEFEGGMVTFEGVTCDGGRVVGPWPGGCPPTRWPEA